MYNQHAAYFQEAALSNHGIQVRLAPVLQRNPLLFGCQLKQGGFTLPDQHPLHKNLEHFISPQQFYMIYVSMDNPKKKTTCTKY